MALLGLGTWSGGCGGSSTRTTSPGDGDASGAAGQATAGAGTAGAPPGGTANNTAGAEQSAGAAGAGTAGAGGTTIIITSDPPTCETEDGREGIVVDTFPYPSPVTHCEPVEQPGTPDANCPEEPRVKCIRSECLLEAAFAGCCRPDGTCGLLDSGRFSSKASLGCFSRDPWIENDQWLGEEKRPVPCSSR